MVVSLRIYVDTGMKQGFRQLNSQFETVQQEYIIMARSQLRTALDAHRGRNHKVEKQRKLQKQAAKRKGVKDLTQSVPGSHKVDSKTNGTVPLPEGESEGWKSDESEAAEPEPVCRHPSLLIHFC